MLPAAIACSCAVYGLKVAAVVFPLGLAVGAWILKRALQ